MTTTEQAHLESLLAAAATEPTRVPAFVAELLQATVIVPGVVSDAEGGGQTATFPPLVGPDRAPVQPFFTSEERLQETIAAIPGYEGRYIGLPCRAFWEMTRGATLVLNPHSSHGKEFLPGEIAHVLDGAAAVTTTVVEAETPIMVGQPAHVPPGMEDALSAMFARQEAVTEAVLGWKVTPSTNDQAYLLVVVGSEDVRERIGDDLSRSLVLFSQAHPVDVMYTTPGASHMLSSIAPFYRKAAPRRSLFGRKSR
ncbi:enhanced serine sensitivity protein SseB C-terminal domain-containing protein [Labedella endophytica]|uniref:Enhanced serine sensitivity protein SseB n=1 Tax=Labedella endophytica TaxID=1523160 RepID=A0A433JSM8_9MICO|nr:enhanced serine sensitivity protein SseB C-terminal domain-containing protein [Labedella endophytica]RUR00995.1 hypothetical protein ELQ94_05525 [Labedella endophytica]